ncbi:vacuolar protein sorting-associated protein 41 homolog [Liolophura sinensis]|uniref:vacuolar protein sorting-associated protein 41 homolog n=1 Tax=Liolophura sinensis TaxID=3198878 RepID=UPI00315981F9
MAEMQEESKSEAASNLTEEGEEEDSEDESEEEVEPKLKYERIGNDLTGILSKDAASCMAVHPKFLALGTHWGMIHILDHAGNNIRSKEIAAHTTTVNQISIDDAGDFMASCSDDGRVVITGLYTESNNQTVNFDRPIKAVAVDPLFFKAGSGKHYVTGDDKLILNEKGFLNRHKTNVLHQGEGPIRSVKWKSHFIAWANDVGVKVYDMSSRTRITHIAKDHSHRSDMYRCNLAWKDDRTLLIGWANGIKVCVVKERAQDDIRDLPSRYVEITAMFKLESYICGIAPLGGNLVVLMYDREVQLEGGKPVANRPHLIVVEPKMGDYVELSNDALSIRGFTEYRCNDYHLECISEESLFYIVSPKDVVVSKLRDQDDHISWLLDHEMFEEAMAAAMEHSKELKKHNYQEIGRLQLEHLLENEAYDDASRLCVKILGKNKELWEEEVYKFAKIRQLKTIAPYLPQGDPKLSPAIYEMVLNEYLQSDYKGFHQLVKSWPCTLYNIQTIVNAVLDRLDRDRNDRTLLQSLADLHTYEKRFDKALAIYLRLQDPGVFKLIHKHNLFDAINDKIVQLMQFDRDQAVNMLLDNIDKIPIEKVYQQLEKSPALLHVYLDRLFQKDPHLGQAFHARQVSLYAEYDPSRLLMFLRTSSYYPLQAAMKECETRDLLPEQVFLLGRIGQTKQALKLITNRLKDVDQAIEFCKEHNDEELWEDLISYSIDKPNFVTGLLQNIGTHVDPIILIQKIRQGMEIPGLRDSLVKILQDYNLQISLREGCRKILVADSFGLSDKQVKMQRRGICVEGSQMCQICHQRILVSDLRYASNIAVFFCRHAFHEDCLPVHAMERCAICSTQRRGPGSRDTFRK